MTATAEPLQTCPTSLIPVDEMSPDSWFICSTWSRHEMPLAEHLAREGVNFFLPLVRIKREKLNGSGRKRKMVVERPKFSKYLFLNGQDAREVAQLHSRRSTTVFHTISAVAPKSQAALHFELVQLYRAYQVNPWIDNVCDMQLGQKVRIIDGPMLGVEGNLSKIDEHRGKLFLNVGEIGKAMCLEIAMDMVEAVDV